jgi:hypothetical protein
LSSLTDSLRFTDHQLETLLAQLSEVVSSRPR